MSVTIGRKKLKNNRYSLFLDISLGGKRWKEYLGIHLDNPISSEIGRINKQRMRLADDLRLQRERQLLGVESTVSHPVRRTFFVDFLDVFAGFLADYRRKDIKIVYAVGKYLHRFVGKKTLPISLVDKKFCEDFFLYLQQHLHGNTPVGYFKKFKMCLERCVEDGLLLANPARGIRLIYSDELVKDILSADEIQRLADTPLADSEVKRAFLFACHTGLRWCDISVLRYKSIDYQRRIITIRQQKVMSHSSKAVLHLNMNDTTVNLLRLRSGDPDDLVFALPSYSYTRRVLHHWTKAAGINKHITFHCARHSFVTNIMLGGANIKTASLLAGHSTIRHTEKYVHVIDELKQKAVNSLPEIILHF